MARKPGFRSRSIQATLAAAMCKTKVDELLDTLRHYSPNALDIGTLSVILGTTAKRVRGLIDPARAKHGSKVIARGDAKSNFKAAQ